MSGWNKGGVWNLMGRCNGGRRPSPSINPDENPALCPSCKRVGVHHLYAEPKYRFCDEDGCSWRSCPLCRLTWDMKSGAMMSITRPPIPV